jgi:hypothetical protein
MGVFRTTDGVCVPNDLANVDWQEYQRWLLVPGNVPDPYVPLPPPTPDQIYAQELQAYRLLKAVVLCLNDGTLTVGTNLTPLQLKNIVRAKL